MRKLYPLILCAVFMTGWMNMAFSQCSVSISGTDTICPGANTMFIAKITNGNPTAFSWSSTPTGTYPNDDTIIVAPTANTTYTVQVSGNGCTASASVTVVMKTVPGTPSMTFSPNDVCAGTPLSFKTTGVAGLNYKWVYGDGFFGFGSSTTHTYETFGNGTVNYTAQIIATGANGCSTAFSQTVSVLQAPLPLLQEGNTVDTTTFNGVLTFYKCYTNGQTSSVFNFINASIPATGVTSTIIWGDTGANFTTTSPWTIINHTYGIGIFDLDYIITNANGCTDTTRYKVFFGSNAAGGIATLGSTNICGPGSLIFILTNWQNNSPGTLYQITFNDSTPPLTFVQPPPDSIIHEFTRGSCGTNSSNGIITYPNSFAAYMVVTNPCGPTSGSVLPIYVSLSPVAKFTVSGNDTVCQNTMATVTNQTISGEVISNGNCSNTDTIRWGITPATGWTMNSGILGNDSTPGSNTLQITFNTLGSYQITLVANNSCGQPDTTSQTVCVGTPPTPAFTLPSTLGCAPYTLTPNNTTPIPNGCSQVKYNWTATQTSSTCTPDSLKNYAFTGGTGAGSIDPNIDFYNQGTYNLILTATNACGTYTTNAQTVTVKDKPDATIGALSTICAGQTVSPTVSAPQPCGGTISSYSWAFQGGSPATSNNQTPGAISFATPGIDAVSLSVTNECGTNTFTDNLNVDTIPVANAGPDQQICSGANVQLGTATVTGYTYSWSPQTDLSFPLVAQPFVTATDNGAAPDTTEYYLTVSNGGTCTAKDSVNVIINPGVTVFAGFGQSVCAGHSVTLNGSYGGATTSVTWTSNNGGTFSDSTSPTSTYTPSITNGNITLTLTTNKPSGSCPAATSNTNITVIAPPVANPGANDSICGGSTVQLGGQFQFGYSYAWSPPTGLNFTFTANPECTLSNNTNNILNQVYTLIVSATGCADTAQVTVSVFPPAADSAGPPVTVCAGSQVNITGTISGGASSATWSSPSGSFTNPASLSTQFIPSVDSGIAVVILTTNDPVGPCPAVLSSVSDTVNPLATITNNPLSQTICSGSSTQIIALTSSLTNSTYNWTMSSPDGVTGFPGAGSSPFIMPHTLLNPNDTAGTVLIQITPTADGCPGVSSDYIITVNPLPNVILPATQTICNGDSFSTINLSSDVIGTTYNWTSTAETSLSGNTATGTGNIPRQVLNNAGTDTGIVIFTVVPVANNCTGISSNYVVIVEPTPAVVFAPTPQNICSGQTSQQVALTSPTPGTAIQWSATLPNGLSSSDTIGTTTIPPQTLFDTIPQFLTIQYIAQAFTSGTVCPGTLADYSITVQPIPQIDFDLSINSGCTPLLVNVVPVITNLGVPDSVTFDWDDGTANSVLYPNMTVPIWNSLHHDFYNNSSQPVVYNVGISAHNLCIDTTVTHPVSLLPNLITAFFTPSITSGCEPLTVNFQDESTGAGMLSWCFDYDVANNTCPSGGVVDTAGSLVTHTFTTAGNYTVALYITNGFGCAHDSSFQVINVAPAPVASFTSTNNLCAGSSVQFTDTSTAPSGSFISAFDWQFGDGDSSNVSNPNHTYSSAGVYSVWLQVTSSFGCSDSISEPVTILNKPVAAFTYDTVCANTPPTQFTNTSTGALFYTWDFGDGNTSSAQSPAHPYPAAGSYQVTLISSTSTCSDTAVSDITVFPVPVADFILPVNYNCGVPAEIPTTNISTGTTGYTWNFWDGTTSTLTEPTITYTTTGTYTITLSATNEFQCVDTFSAVINIYPVPAINSVTVSPANGCQPLNVQFSASATNANLYNWNFGGGNIISTSASTAFLTYPDTGSYSVQLTVYSFKDCGDTLLLTDTVNVYQNPTAMFTYSINENVEPVNGTVQFINESLNSSSFIWGFGDGTNSAEINPSHLYQTIDSFQVMLIAITGYGCRDSAFKDIYVIHKSLYVPNAFAPDYTGTNKLVATWLPVGEGLASYHAQIFDKWGELLWESTSLNSDLSPAEGWDGLYQGQPVQQGTYVWKIDATFTDGTNWEGMAYKPDDTRKTIGSITLIR